MKYNVILFTDAPNPENFTRGYGAYRIATEIRKLGHSVLTVDFSSALSEDTFDKILNLAVGDETFFVGFSTTWFPHTGELSSNNKFIYGKKSVLLDTRSDFHLIDQDWYFNSVAFQISKGGIKKFVDKIKNINPKTKVILGGANASEYVKEPSLDHVFIGYSENQIVDFVKSITKSGPLRIFNKIINYDTKANSGEFNFNNSCTEYVDSDCIHPDEHMTIEFSRGCIFNCTFCSFPHRNQNTKNYMKCKDVLRAELMSNWEKWGVTRYVITDDTFNDYTDKLRDIDEVVKSLPFTPIFYFAFIRMDLMTAEQATLIKSIGVKEVFYGLDAWDVAAAKAISKGGNREKKIAGIRTAKECWGNDVYIGAYIIIGLPNDTLEGITESVNWYINEGYQWLDTLRYVTYMIRQKSDVQQYQFLSIIEADPDKWGYSFPNPDDYLYWEKNDNGNITSRTMANQLMFEANEKVEPYYRQKKTDWNDLYPKSEEYTSLSKSDLYFYATNKKYFPRLLDVLSKS